MTLPSTETFHIQKLNTNYIQGRFTGASITIMDSEGASVELIEGKQFEGGLYSVGVDVDNLDATLEELDKHGCKPITPIIPTSVGRQAFILDPNGVRICLIEHNAEYKAKYMK